MAPTAARSVTVRAHGHPMLRGTHAKTFELTAEAAVGPRATCVIGVAAHWPDSLSRLRGEVRLELRAGGASASGSAIINPDHRVYAGGRLIVRRSDRADPDTLAVRSTLTAADLPAAMVDALGSADAAVELTVTEASPPPPLTIVGEPTQPGRLQALAAVAEPVNVARPPQDWSGLVYIARTTVDWPTPYGRAWLTAAHAAGGRFAPADPLAVPVAALLAAALPPTPHVWLGTVGRGTLKDRTSRALILGSAAPVVLVPAPDAIAATLAVAAADPQRPVAVPDGRLDTGLGLRWTTAAALAAGPPEWPDAAPLVVAPADGAGDGAIDVATLVRALTAAGVPARTLAEALTPLGWDRRAIYRVLDAQRGPRNGDGG